MIMKWIIDVFKYALIDLKLQHGVKKRYYTDAQFSRLDHSLINTYIFKNPYQISKRYLRRKQEEDIHTYGETPLVTYEAIAKEAEISSTDAFLELGCGRGRGALFLHHFFHCEVIGIERIPLFVRLAKHITQKHHLKDVSFICGDMTEMKLPKASVVYLYGTCLEDTEIEPIVQELKTFSKGTRIVTISYPLTDYDEEAFQITKTFPVSFPWGETEAYLQVLK